MASPSDGRGGAARGRRGQRADLLRAADARTRRRCSNVAVEQIPAGARGLYFALAIVGIFSLLVGAAVRLRRPDHQATLHFFWLSIAFFGMLAFSFSGRLDSLDWIFYWGDITARLLLPPLFVHFALVFPGASRQLGAQRRRPSAAAADLPAGGAPRRRGGGSRAARRLRSGAVLATIAELAERGELLYLAASLVGGLAIMIRALRRGCSVTARRQLRWIVWGTALGAVPFVIGYVVPYTLGFTPSGELRADGRPARPGAARVRVGHHPLPADGRRGHHQARLWSSRRRLPRLPPSTRCCSAWRGGSSCTARISGATRSSRCSPRSSSCCCRAR